jgi:hypothetical protein
MHAAHYLFFSIRLLTLLLGFFCWEGRKGMPTHFVFSTSTMESHLAFGPVLFYGYGIN